MRGFFCVSRRRATSRAVVCPGLLAGFKGAAALLPVGVDIRLDIHFVCPPPIRPILWLSRWTSATARELESAAYFFTEKAGYENTPSLTNGYCIPDRSPLGLHPSGHPAKHKDSLKFSACFLWSLRDWLNGEMIARHLHFSLCLSSVSPAGRAGELRSNS